MVACRVCGATDNKKMSKRKITLHTGKVLVQGNLPDIQKSKVIDTVKELENYVSSVSIYDPLADIEDVQSKFNLTVLEKTVDAEFDALVLAVTHEEPIQNIYEFVNTLKSKYLIYDLKEVLPEKYTAMRL
ncbi:UDP binding domain-containing protein [Planctobacterium marinum]|uniref:UDP binding domain-containing protein n=2 Tax=Planctobacterium marinum TaxID=1631968 RepID=UPI0036711DEB